MQLIIDLVLALKNVPIFSQIPDHVIAEIAEIIEIQEFSSGETLIHKGDIGDCMYVIREGSVEIKDGQNILAVLKENELVGELSLLAPVQRTASVVAKDDLVVFRIEREFFLELVYEEPTIVSGLLGVLVSRIIDQNNIITELRTKP